MLDWKLVVMLMMKCSLQVCAAPRVKLEVGRGFDVMCSVQGCQVPRVKLEVGCGFDGDVLSAGMPGT